MRRSNLYKVGLVTSMIIFIAGMSAGCGSKVSLVEKTLVHEQGEPLSTSVGTYLKGDEEKLADCTLDLSEVDVNTVGKYKASVEYGKKTIDFKIEIVDTVSPSVELYTDDFAAAPASAIHILDVVKSVSDNASFGVGFSDDLTKADKDKKLLSEITFDSEGIYNAEVCARDEYGNTTVVPFLVEIVTDKEPPMISGLADTEYTTVGTEIDFTSKGVATDNIEGDISSKIKYDTGNLDFNTPGTYTVTASVSDGCGNETVKTINVVVQDVSATMNTNTGETISGDFSQYSNESVPYGYGKEVDENNRPTGVQWYANKFGNYAADFIQPMSNNIYLTFDLGYEFGCTSEILDILKEKNVKAVFFLTLNYAQDNQELVWRMINEGHVIGNHSVTHPNAGMPSLTTEQQIDEIKKVNDYVLDTYGYQMYLWRFPTGAFSERGLAIVQSMGYRSVFWSFAHKDWLTDDQPDVQSSLQNALDKAHGGAIYLLHGQSWTNTKMLADFIDGCRAKGFEFAYYGKVN